MNRVFFYLKEGTKNVFRSKNTSFATLLSMSITIFILGIILFIVLNLNNFVLMAKDDFSGIQIFLKNEVDTLQIQEFENFIKNNKDFSNIKYITKEEIMQNFIKNMDSDSSLFSNIENPCENSFIVHINDSEKSDFLVEELKKDTRVSSISYYAQTLNILIKISKAVSIASIFIIGILFMLSLMIIENMIKVSIFSRIREIKIMKTIGATNWFIRWPFIIEGAILGLLGSGISCFFLDIIYIKIHSTLAISNILLKYTISRNLMQNLILSLFLPSGVGIGILGSITSLRKYLKV